jgi:hypothetical protein
MSEIKKAIANVVEGKSRNFLEYTDEYKAFVKKAYTEKGEALQMHAAQLDEVIKLLRPMESSYRRFIAEKQVLGEKVQPSYFLRRREGGSVQYQNTQDGLLNHQRVVPGQRFSVPPMHYVETATWPEFEIWEDIDARDESLAQLAVAMDAQIDLDAWTLIDLSIKAASNDIDRSNTATGGATASVFDFADLDALLDHFKDQGFGDMIGEVHIFMNTEAERGLKNDARTRNFSYNDAIAGLNIHILPSSASSYGDYGFYIPTTASTTVTTFQSNSRVYAILPKNYSREYIVESNGQEMLIEDYVPNAAGFERGIKAITRISRVILDDRKAVSVRYKD